MKRMMTVVFFLMAAQISFAQSNSTRPPLIPEPQSEENQQPAEVTPQEMQKAIDEMTILLRDHLKMKSQDGLDPRVNESNEHLYKYYSERLVKRMKEEASQNPPSRKTMTWILGMRHNFAEFGYIGEPVKSHYRKIAKAYLVQEFDIPIEENGSPD